MWPWHVKMATQNFVVTVWLCLSLTDWLTVLMAMNDTNFFIGPESDHWQRLSLTIWLTPSLTPVKETWFLWPLSVKMPTQNSLMLLLLLMLMMRIMLATVCCRFRSWGLVIKLYFCSDFEHKVWSRFWSRLLMLGWGYEVESWSRFWS